MIRMRSLRWYYCYCCYGCTHHHKYYYSRILVPNVLTNVDERVPEMLLNRKHLALQSRWRARAKIRRGTIRSVRHIAGAPLGHRNRFSLSSTCE